jgi:hypothetical protein
MSSSPQLLRADHRNCASWDDGWRLVLDSETRRGVLWSRRGLICAHDRAARAGTIAFDHWSAAVEAVWWAVALDDVLDFLLDGRYRPARAAARDGTTVVGLRWLRHQHAHRIVVTGRGGPKRDFIGPAGGPPFYISPTNRWLPRSEISSSDRRRDKVSEAAYDACVAGHPLELPIAESIKWLDSVLRASGVALDDELDGGDPTIL